MNSILSRWLVVLVIFLPWGACFAEEETNEYSASDAALDDLYELGFVTPEVREAAEAEFRAEIIAERPDAAEYPEWYWKKTMKGYFIGMKLSVYLAQGRSDSQIAETYEWKLLVELTYPVYEDLPYMNEDDHRIGEEFFKCILTTNGITSCINVMMMESSARTG